METKEILKSLRKSRGYNNMKEFCDASGISINTYQNYESGKRTPTADILLKLADFYGVTVDYLLGREPQKETPLRTFAKGVNLKELEEILIKEYLELNDKQREAVLGFLRRCIDKEQNQKENKLYIAANSDNNEEPKIVTDNGLIEKLDKIPPVTDKKKLQ